MCLFAPHRWPARVDRALATGPATVPKRVRIRAGAHDEALL
jgi:hypothetical protein